MQTQAPLTLTQLLERFRGFNSIAPNTNFINFRPTQLIQYIATLEATELELADKDAAMEFILQNHCTPKAREDCAVCQGLIKVLTQWKR